MVELIDEISVCLYHSLTKKNHSNTNDEFLSLKFISSPETKQRTASRKKKKTKKWTEWNWELRWRFPNSLRLEKKLEIIFRRSPNFGFLCTRAPMELRMFFALMILPFLFFFPTQYNQTLARGDITKKSRETDSTFFYDDTCWRFFFHIYIF